MDTIYLDQGATSFPKAPGVAEAITHYICHMGASVNRSAYAAASEVGLMVLSAREQLCELFNFDDASHALFTSGATASLNMVLKGFLSAGDHCIAGPLEHNAVMRPLTQLTKQGVSFSRMAADEQGLIDPASLEPLIQSNTKLVVVSHASNVCGTLAPVAELSAVCKKHGIPLVLDAAQTAGHYPVDFHALGLSALCAPGHKGLLGPQGVGVLLLDQGFASKLTPLLSGGTGSRSDSEELPPYMPDRLEAGTPNIPGILGLGAALEFVLKTDVTTLRAHETALTQRFLSGIEDLSLRGVRLVGTRDLEKRVGVVSLDFLNQDNATVAYALEREHNILTRCGLHCAPNAHKTLHTFPQGTVRFSFGHATTSEEIDAAIEALHRLV